jgi:small subunit ribosomal protein S17
MSDQPPAGANAASKTARAPRKVIRGVVTSDKMNKTITVSVTVRVPHPKYPKIGKRITKHKAHDETNDAKIGDTVEISEARPLSKTKRWRLVRVVERAVQ